MIIWTAWTKSYYYCNYFFVFWNLFQ